MTDQQIRVAIADDHKIFRDGIRMALKDKEFLKIVWEAEDGKDLMHKLKIKLPDVILMDILGFDPINQLPGKCSGKRKILEENIFSFFYVR